jgi:hypothetical protein
VLAAGLITVALVAVACGDDGDDTGADGASTTTAEEAGTSATLPSTTTTAAPAEAYPDHTGELYAGTQNWICNPDLGDDPCRDIRATVVDAAGVRTPVDLAPATDPAFDCFFVYPTTSGDPDVNSDLEPDVTEINTVIAQVGRYSSVCRVFAPVYRSVTLAGMGRGAFGTDAREIAYADVLDAWRTYVDEQGGGRGVVLIGHSQGSGHLNRLINEEIGDNPDVRSLIISAVLMGTSVPKEPTLPGCTSADEFGCTISFSSYPAANPPVDGAFFGSASGSPALCVNPAELAGGDGLADAVVPAQGAMGVTDEFRALDTPFVSLPGALRVECAEQGAYGYLAVSLTGVEDARTLDGFLVETLGPTWGLHLYDANLAQDDLIEVVTRQAAAYAEG